MLDTTNRPAETFAIRGAQICPLCNVAAVVPLTATQLAEQPDDTTHVCHPIMGGCNHGFAVDVKAVA